MIDIVTTYQGIIEIFSLVMASQFSLKSKIDSVSIEEEFRLNNLNGFKTYKHNDTGLNVNFANISGPLYTMAVVVPVSA